MSYNHVGFLNFDGKNKFEMWHLQMKEFLKCVRVWHVIQDGFETLAKGIECVVPTGKPRGIIAFLLVLVDLINVFYRDAHLCVRAHMTMHCQQHLNLQIRLELQKNQMISIVGRYDTHPCTVNTRLVSHLGGKIKNTLT